MRRFNPSVVAVVVVCSGAAMAPFVSLTSEPFGWQEFTQAYRTVAIPAVARVEGSGAFFTSRVELFHSSGGDKEVRITYTPRSDFGGDPRVTTVALPGDTLVSVTDPLAEWFGIGGGEDAVGSLRLELTDNGGPSPDDELFAQSVVFARNDDGSEFGQFFPALTGADAIVAGQTGYLASTVNAQVYRVNVGLMALTDGTSVTVTPLDPIGSALAAGRTFDLDDGDNRQLNNIFEVFRIAPRDNIVVAVEVSSGMALAYASILDGNIAYEGTSDPTTILPVTQGASEVTLLEVGPIQGFDEFSGSATVTNLSDEMAVVFAEFFARGVPGVAANTTFTIPAGGTLGFEDIVGDLFGIQGVGALRLTSQNDTLISSSAREFAIFRDAGGAVIGTAGQAIPGMVPDELLVPGATYHLLGLREALTPSGRERSHIAAFNPGTATVVLDVELYDGATGDSEGDTRLFVRGGELIQVNSIIAVIDPSQDGAVKRLEVEASGPVYVRAFRVNKDGDPITIPPQRED